MVMKNVLITGITGQDGIFLTKILSIYLPNLNIFGTSRSEKVDSFKKNLQHLNINNFQNINLVKTNLLDYYSTNNLIKDINPDAVFNLSGPSSVYESLNNPNIEVEIEKIFNNLSNSLIQNENFCKFFQASSSEMFSDSNKLLDENSDFKPTSPYANAKLKNHLMVNKLKKQYDWQIYSGIMFNHESEFRSKDFLVMKIILNAIAIKQKKIEKLTIGSLDYVRDWSYAYDIAEAMYKIVNDGKDSSYVIASGTSHSIKYIIEFVFSYLDLNWENYVEVDESLLRKGDPVYKYANNNKILNDLDWKASTSIESMLEIIIKNKLSKS